MEDFGFVSWLTSVQSFNIEWTFNSIKLLDNYYESTTVFLWY